MRIRCSIWCMALSFVLLSFFCACRQSSSNELILQNRVDSLEKQLAKTYKPGLGEFMSGIQVHHIKLWFAGINQNWKLADFEMHEIREYLDDIQQYNTDRPETKSIPMIFPALDSVMNAVEQKDIIQFKNSFSLLTISCNNCHKDTDHGFNIVIIPTAPPFTNQDFRPMK